MNRIARVRYVDLGFASARQLWVEVGLLAYERFIDAPSGRTAIEAAVQAWHVHEWLWHEDQRGSQKLGTLSAYRQAIVGSCPELAWVQDIAEAGKHCGLKRPSVTVTRAAQMPVFLVFDKGTATFGGAAAIYGSTLQIELDDGSRHDVASVLATAVAFWKAKFGL